MAWPRLVAKIALAAVALLLVAAGTAYATDAGVDATVTDTHCDSVDPATLTGLPPLAALARQAAARGDVHVRTLLGLQMTRHLDALSCQSVQPGNLVVYHLRSGRASVYQDASKTVCLFDSVYGAGAC